jgi:hypothetical protein
MGSWYGGKNKANSNPIQSQLGPKQSQFKALGLSREDLASGRKVLWLPKRFRVLDGGPNSLSKNV